MPKKIIFVHPKLHPLSAVNKRALHKFMQHHSRGANLEKIETASKEFNSYTIRVNDTVRLFLNSVPSERLSSPEVMEERKKKKKQKKKQKQKQVWTLTNILDNHQYEEIKRKPGHWFHKQIEKTLEVSIEVPEAEEKETEIPDEVVIEPSSRIELGQEHFVLLDELQESTKSLPLPLTLCGAPGSGKSSLLLSILKKNAIQKPDLKYLVFARSPALIETLKEQWAAIAEFEGLQHVQVDFKTPRQLHQDNSVAPPPPEHGLPEFCAWFSRYTAQQQIFNPQCQIPNKDEAHLVYQEFRIMCGYKTLAEYNHKVGTSVYNDLQIRASIWDALTNYRQELQKQNVIDYSFFPMSNTQKYDVCYGDEIQDLSREQIRSQAAQQPNTLWCVGDHQHIFGSESTVPFIKSVYYEQQEGIPDHKKISPAHQMLQASYRCPQKIIEFANFILDMKYFAIGKKERNKNELAYVRSPEDLKEGAPYWLEKPSDLTPLINDRENADFAVVTSPEHLAEAQRLFGKKRVFTPEGIKGLQYKHILLYRLFEQDKYTALDPFINHFEKNTPLPTTLSHSLRHSIACNELFVGITRAESSLSVYQPEKPGIRHIRQAIKESILRINSVSAHPQATPTISGNEDWKQRQKTLVANGQIDQSQDIEVKDEITPALHLAPKQPMPAVTQNLKSNKRDKAKKEYKSQEPQEPKDHSMIHTERLLSQIVHQGNPAALKQLLQQADVVNILFETKPKGINSTVGYFLLTDQQAKLQKVLLSLLKELQSSKSLSLLQQKQMDSFMAILNYPLNNQYPFRNLLQGDTKILLWMQHQMMRRMSEIDERLKKDDVTAVEPYLFIDHTLKKLPNKVLMEEIRCKHTVVIESLRQRGFIDLNTTKISEMHFALHSAAALGYEDVLTKLIGMGAHPNIPNIVAEETPAMEAARHGHTHILKALYEKDANLEARSNRGETALTIAVEKGHIEAVKYLLSHNVVMPPVYRLPEQWRRLSIFSSLDSQKFHSFINRKEIEDNEKIFMLPKEIAHIMGFTEIEALLLAKEQENTERFMGANDKIDSELKQIKDKDIPFKSVFFPPAPNASPPEALAQGPTYAAAVPEDP